MDEEKKEPGNPGVLDLSWGRGCRPYPETQTLFMIKSSWEIDTLFMMFRSNYTHFFIKMRDF